MGRKKRSKNKVENVTTAKTVLKAELRELREAVEHLEALID